MEIRLLGPLEVFHDSERVEVAGTRQRELLAVLALHAGQVVSTDRLMEDLWGEDQPAAGVTTLRVRVSQLRKALGPAGEAVVTRPPGYALIVGRDELDLWRFERLLGEGERSLGAGDPARALESLRTALALWRGAPLADFAYAPFAQAAVVRLEELRAAALELRIEAELSLGRSAQVIAELQALVGQYPLRERLWAQLMTALYRDGRQADALAVYRTARTRLIEEIGIEPGAELKALERRILEQDPALEGREATARPARTVLALSDGTGGIPALARRLADRAGHEVVAVALVRDAAGIPAATARLREADPGARCVAFTSAAPGADAVRLAAEQDAAAALIAAPRALVERGTFDGDLAALLAGAACDVGILAGAAPGDGPVLVPFSGHDRDWAAVELAAWLAGAGGVTLLGVSGGRGRRDASRLLASASLAIQRGLGVPADTQLVDDGPEGILAAAPGAAVIIVGIAERWSREGLGKARLRVVREAPCPVLVVHRGVRPSGLAPPEALTCFSWSGGG